MILATNATIAAQCSRCGQLEFQGLSFFAFAGQERVTLSCNCGAPLLTIASRDRRQFNISYQCAFCGETHYLRVNRKVIWGHEVLPLICPEMETSVGFIGPKQKVSQAYQEREKSIGDLAAELGYEEEFENPEVMLKILDHLHQLAKNGALGCNCGNRQLSFELLPDRIELYCEYCEALGIIHADNPENIRPIEGMTSLTLEENKTCQINRPFRGQHLVKSKEEERV